MNTEAYLQDVKCYVEQLTSSLSAQVILYTGMYVVIRLLDASGYTACKINVWRSIYDEATCVEVHLLEFVTQDLQHIQEILAVQRTGLDIARNIKEHYAVDNQLSYGTPKS